MTANANATRSIINEKGIWLIWAGVGINASLSSLGYHWAISQSAALLLFSIFCWDYVDKKRVLRSLLFTMGEIFFKNFDVAGIARIPETGPVILACAPHANQFVDAIVIMKAISNRDIGFLTAAKTVRRRYVGALVSGLHAIPVERPRDIAVQGTGTLSIAQNKGGQAVVLKGNTATQFESEVSKGAKLKITSRDNVIFTASVSEITSDRRILLKRPFKAEDDVHAALKPHLSHLSNSGSNSGSEQKEKGEGKTGEARLEEGVDYSFTVLPWVDQSKVWQSVTDRLKQGGAVGIFPEGGSHDRTEMLPLKHGVTIMALGALAQGIPVTIVPVGINYFKGHRFRSRVFVDIGTTITPDPKLVADYLQGGAAKQTACNELLNQVLTGLGAVTVQAPDFRSLQFLRAMRRLYKPSNKVLSPDERMDLMKAFSTGYSQVKDAPQVKALEQEVFNYRQNLDQYGIEDYKVMHAEVDMQQQQQQRDQSRKNPPVLRVLEKSHIVAVMGHRIFLLLIFLIFAVPGQVMALPMTLTTRVISRQKAAEAAKHSTVKIRGTDVIATWKLLISLVMVPLMHLAYTTATFYFLGETSGVIFFFFSPFVAITSIYATEMGGRLLQSIRPLLFINKKTGLDLVNKRKALQHKAREVVKKFGWDRSLKQSASSTHLYRDFENSRSD